jgi:two-component system phosphate regulon sensor histidine kinase PhoR
VLTEPAARLRDWALFATAALLPAVALGALSLRAVGNESAAVEREAKLSLEASAERVARSIPAELDAAAARATRDSAALARTAPPFAEPVVLDADRTPRGATAGIALPPVDPACAARLSTLAAARQAELRRAQRADVLATCAEAVTAAGRWIYPLVVVEGFSATDGAPFAAWLEAHGGRLSTVERAAVAEDARSLTLDDATRARVAAALSVAPAGVSSLPALLREPEVAEALRRGPQADGLVRWRARGSLGALRTVDGGGLAGFVVHRGSLDAGLARGWPALPADQRGRIVSQASAAPAPFVATRAITTELSLAVGLADGGVLARRTRRSRLMLGVAGLVATVGAFAVAAVLFARMRAARRASALRTDFVAAVSHELRTPIASVRMLAELLEENRVEDGERDEVHRALAAEARRLGGTVDRLLGFARMESGKRAVLRERLAVAPVVESSIAVFEARHPEHPVVRELDPSIEASIDPAEIRLAVDNLLANAHKYAPDGAPYVVRLSDDGREIDISVEDHGPGIARRDHARIFEPFERADDRLSEATEGTGIGLSLVRNVARAHGGDARVDSEPGRGARFHLTLARGDA